MAKKKQKNNSTKQQKRTVSASRTHSKDVGPVNILQKWDRIIYTDGGCIRNPGGPGGIGAVIINTETGEIMEISQGYESTTNNRMEILAAITALKLVPNGCNVFLHSDSQYLLNTICGIWKKKKNMDLWKLLDAELFRMGTVATQWVRGHNGDPHNERCDELATRAIRSDLIPDEGYVHSASSTSKEFFDNDPADSISFQQTTQQNTSPDNLNSVWEKGTTAENLVAKEGIHLSCAQQICTFYKKSNHRFADYMQLKTGGMDVFSKKTKSYFIDRFGEKAWHQAEDIVGNAAITALRWHARGLSLHDAIRKAQVDAEVSANCQK